MPSIRHSLLALAAASAFTVPLVRADGFINRIEADGVGYDGYDAWHDAELRDGVRKIVRAKETTYPVSNLRSQDMNCGLGNGDSPAALVADVTAGSNITVQWGPAMGNFTYPDDEDGPIMMYAADCHGDCTTFTPSGATWVKLYDVGLLPDGQFANTKLVNGSWSFPVPDSLAPGQYLFQFTILGLNIANIPHFYPQCAQFNVLGGGSTNITSLPLVDMTEVYLNANGVYVDLWNVQEHIDTGKWSTYDIPGPAILDALLKSGAASASAPAAPAAKNYWVSAASAWSNRVRRWD